MSFLDSLKNIARRAYAQVNPFDNGASFVNPAPRPAAPAPAPVQQQPRRQAPPAKPVSQNILSRTAGLGLNLGKTLVNATGVPSVIDTARLGLAGLTHNDKAANAAKLRLAQNVPQVLPIAIAEGFKPFAQDVATAITAPYASHIAQQEADRARRELFIPNATPAYRAAVEAYANGLQTNILNQHLQTSGIGMNTSTPTVARHVIGNAVNTAANLALADRLPAIAENPASAGQVARNATAYGGINAAGSVGAVAAQPNATPTDYLKAAGIGFVGGAGLPIAGASGRLALKGANIALAHAPELTSRGVDLVNNVAIPRANLHDQNVLESYSNYLSGAEKPSGSELNSLISEARKVGQKHGIDLMTGSMLDRLTRANSILDTIGQHNRETVQGGYIGGKQALSFNEQQLSGKVFNGPDLRQRFEASDAAAAVRSPSQAFAQDGSGTHLSDVLQHPTLFQDYPQLQAVRIREITPSNSKLYGGYDQSRNTIYLNTAVTANPDLMKQVLMHEVQHVIQNIEGFPQGTTSKASGAAGYKLSPGEQEAKAVGDRVNMSQDQLAVAPIRLSPPNTAMDIVSPASIAALERTPEPMQSVGDILSQRPPVTPPPTDNISLPSNETGKTSKLRFTNRTVQNSNEVSQPVKELVKGKKGPTISNAKTVVISENLVQSNPDKAAQVVNEALNKKTGTLTAQEVSNGISLAKYLDAVNTDVSHEQAGTIYDRLAEHLRAAGQEVQAAALLSRQTSQGLYYQAHKTLTNNGVEITPELNQALRGKLEAVKATDAAHNELDTIGSQLDSTPLSSPQHNELLQQYAAKKEELYQREQAIYGFQQIVASALPKGKAGKLLEIWKGGLLTAPTTTAGNILSNVVETATTAGIRDPLAAAIDAALAGAGKAAKGIGLISKESSIGNRTKTIAGGRGGFRLGLKRGAEYLKTGFDIRDVTGKYNLNEKSTTSIYPGGIFKLLGAQDQPFWYYNYNRSLANQAKAEAINQGLKGAERDEFVKTFMIKPPDAAQSIAENDARRSVFGNETVLGSIASAARRAKFTDTQGRVHKAENVVGFIMPFSRVPASIAMRILERSPAGPVMEVAHQIANGKYDQRQLVDSLADSAVGTLGSLTLGSALVKANAITLGYPTDAQTQNQWQLEGKQPYSIRVGNRWYSLNYLQPFGSILASGAQYAQSRSDGKSIPQSMADAAAAAGKAVVGQSFLQGVSGVLSAIQQPEQAAQTFLNSTAGSIVPNIVKRGAAAIDPLQRQTNNPLQAVEAGIPGLRQTLPAKLDTLGNPLPRSSSPLDVLANPLRPSNARENALTTELDRLRNTPSDTGGDYGIIPNKIAKSVTFDGIKTNLNDAQRTDLQQKIGQATQEAWNKIIATPDYQQLSDKDKHLALQNAYDDISAVVKQQFAAANRMGRYAPSFNGKASKLSSRQDALVSSGFDPLNYAVSSGVSTKLAQDLSILSRQTITKVEGMPADKRTAYLKDPKNNYEYQLAKFENDTHIGKLTEVEQYQKLLDLGRLKIQSNYSPEVIQLYGLSKKQLANYLSTHTVSQGTINQLQSLDNALYGSGFISSSKYTSGVSGTTKKAKLQPPLPRIQRFSAKSAPSARYSPTIQSVLGDFHKRLSGLSVLANKRSPSSTESQIRLAV